jgi:hypothetical protein
MQSIGFCQETSKPIAAQDLVLQEVDGLVAGEAEHFVQQEQTNPRAFHIFHSDQTPSLEPDADKPHVGGASGGAYVELLPDSRQTSNDKLIQGESFSNTPGKMAVLTYRVHFRNPGRYYVWVRAYSSGAEDNSIHVGFNGTWPETGQRMQWCEGKNTWRWESKQRTEIEHCGEPYLIYLDVPTVGIHEVQFSMREDGFEFDKWLLTTNREFPRPNDIGPNAKAHTGKLPKAFAYVPPETPKPATESQAAKADDNRLAIYAKQLALQDTGYYLDKGKWLAIDPKKNKQGKVQTAFPYPSGKYHVTLVAVGEEDGKSTYQIAVNDSSIGEFVCPLSKQQFEEGSQYNKTWQNVELNSGDVLTLQSQIASADGKEFSRARIARLEFEPADQATITAVAKLRSTQPTKKPKNTASLVLPRGDDGNGDVAITGELKQWHRVTLTLNGPFSHELDNEPNPFTDRAMVVNFVHESGSPKYSVPGYFAADGNAANSSADSGTGWRAHLSPDKVGKWNYTISFKEGKNAALQGGGRALGPWDNRSGSFQIAPTDKTGSDFRAGGRLTYVGKRYLQYAGSKDYFLKAGTDSPETLLAYSDFDNMIALKVNVPLKSYKTHVADWKSGDPTWGDGKGKGLIGAVNYLSAKGLNSMSFLTYNAAGDGDNIWPFVDRDEKLHWDCSKLDQWGIVLDHATAKGIYLHFKLQENEMDDNRLGDQLNPGNVPESLDGGALGIERKLYCRELIARYAHNLALNWNIGEENTQSYDEVRDMVKYLHDTDPYHHNVVIHTFPGQQDKVYTKLLGDRSLLTGVSLQNSWNTAHQLTLRWIRESEKCGRSWVVAHDEQNPASDGVPADPGYHGNDGTATMGGRKYTMHDIRKLTLWGTIMAGGAGVEYYFGYKLPENDLKLEDFRSRDKSWTYCGIALEFFSKNRIPIAEMKCADELIGNAKNDNSKYCFAKQGELYLVYLPDGGTTTLDLSAATGNFQVEWFNPREGGELTNGNVRQVTAGSNVSLGNPPSDTSGDWLVVVRNQSQ